MYNFRLNTSVAKARIFILEKLALNYGWWFFGDTRSHGMCNHGIDYVG